MGTTMTATAVRLLEDKKEPGGMEVVDGGGGDVSLASLPSMPGFEAKQ